MRDLNHLLPLAIYLASLKKDLPIYQHHFDSKIGFLAVVVVTKVHPTRLIVAYDLFQGNLLS